MMTSSFLVDTMRPNGKEAPKFLELSRLLLRRGCGRGDTNARGCDKSLCIASIHCAL